MRPMSQQPLKVYSLDYLKQKRYSDDTTEDATRIECAGRVVGLVSRLQESHLLHLSEDELQRLKSALFFSTIVNTPVGDAYLNENLIVIDSEGAEYTAGGIPVVKPIKKED